MKLTVYRQQFDDTRTFGRLFLDDLYHSWTLEDKVRAEGEPKVWGETAIPAGTYEVRAHYSPRFQRVVLELQDVPNFDLVYFHGGNTEADTDGCILVGAEKHDTSISNCAPTVKDLETRAFAAMNAGDKVFVEIRNEAAPPEGEHAV